MKKTIILFYSFEGNTRKVGEFLSKELNIPYEEIKPIKDLSSKGFSKYFWGGQQIIMKKKPDLMPLNIKLEEYDTVLVGSPIWAGTFTPAIKTLLEDGILNYKNVAFFYCHDGGPGNPEVKIKEAINKNNKILSIYGLSRVKNDFENLKGGVLNWAKNLEYKDQK